MPVFDWTAPDPQRLRLARPARARYGSGGWRSGRGATLRRWPFLFSTSARQYLDEHFDDEMVKSALGWESISNTLAGPSTPGTAYGLLHEAASGGVGRRRRVGVRAGRHGNRDGAHGRRRA